MPSPSRQAEFRAHRNASDSFLQQFERQWRDYLVAIRRSPGGAGRSLTGDEVSAMTEEQRAQLTKVAENI